MKLEFGSLDWPLLSSYAGLLILSVGSIYAGSFASLPTVKSQIHDGNSQDHEEEDDDDDGERMTLDDAYLFPIVGSVALLGLYLIVKYFGKEWINWFLGWYFSIAGVGTVWKSSVSLLRFVLGESAWKRFDRLSVTAKKGPHRLFSLSFRTPSLFLFPFAVFPSAAYHFWTAGRRSVLVTDILGLSFSHNALALLKLDSFKTGSILLAGLFVYDIWWVFGTEVMVKVATNLDLPIKIMWPKSLFFSGDRGFTMLGLGDIVIPGTFVALALRYDYARHSRRLNEVPPTLVGNNAASEGTENAKHSLLSPSQPSNAVGTTPGKRFEKPYFTAALVAYFIGLSTTMTVMHTFGKAQPALLYLSPACIVSFVVTAVGKGELQEAWAWSDLPGEAEEAEGKEKTKRERDAARVEGSREDRGELTKVGNGSSASSLSSEGNRGVKSEKSDGNGYREPVVGDKSSTSGNGNLEAEATAKATGVMSAGALPQKPMKSMGRR